MRSHSTFRTQKCTTLTHLLSLKRCSLTTDRGIWTPSLKLNQRTQKCFPFQTGFYFEPPDNYHHVLTIPITNQKSIMLCTVTNDQTFSVSFFSPSSPKSFAQFFLSGRLKSSPLRQEYYFSHKFQEAKYKTKL